MSKPSLQDLDWSRAFAKQALSDLQIRDQIVEREKSHPGSVPRCHELHYLQMAAEKVCKAHLIANAGQASVRNTHRVVVTQLPTIYREFAAPLEDRNKRAAAKAKSRSVRRLAEEIEALAPAVKRGGGKPQNAEYPWSGPQQQVVIPCEYDFPELPIQDITLTPVIKVLRAAAYKYANDVL
jgi:hypothetical protein